MKSKPDLSPFRIIVLAVLLVGPFDILLFGQTQKIDSLMNLLSADSSNVRTLIDLSKEARNFSAVESEVYAQRAVRASRAEKRDDKLASSLHALAIAQYQQGNYSEAIANSKEKLDIYVALKDSAYLASSYSFLAFLNYDIGNYEESLRLNLEAKNIVDEVGDIKEKIGIYMNLGTFYGAKKEYEKSIKLYRDVLGFIEPSDFRNMTYVYINIAGIFLKRNLLDSAYSNLKKAHKSVLKVGDNRLLGGIYYDYSKVFKEKNMLDSAMLFAEKCLNLRESKDEKNTLGDVYALIGELYQARGDKNQAMTFFQKAKATAESVGQLERESYFNRQIAELHYENGNFQNAYDFLRNYISNRDSLINESKTKAIREVEARYELAVKEKENEALRKDQELFKQITLRHKIVLVSMIAGVFLLALVFYFKSKTSQLKAVWLKDRVDHQNRELAAKVMHISKKSEMLVQLKNDLSSIQSNNTKKEIESIIRKIDQEFDFDKNLDEFKLHFEKIHPGFFSKLNQLGSDLSPTDLRLCAYIRMNLSTKEIAQLTHSTVRSVQQAKYRINKKLPSSKEDLTSFLMRL